MNAYLLYRLVFFNSIRKFFLITGISIFLILNTLTLRAVSPDLHFYQTMKSWSNQMDWPGEINDVVIGSKGFLWVATTEGLIRFDGEFNETYQVASHINLQSNNIKSLYAALDGSLIIASSRGISTLSNNSITPLLRFEELVFTVYQMIQLKTGQLLLATNRGLYTIKNGALNPLFAELSNQEIYSFEYLDNTLWIAGEGRLWSLRNDNLEEVILPEGLKNNAIFDLETHNAELWLATEQGVWKKSGSSFTPLKDFPIDESVLTLLSDRHGTLWIAGSEMYARLLPNKTLNILRRGVDNYGFKANMVKFIEDAHGNLWEVTRDNVLGFSDVVGNYYRVSATEGLSSAELDVLSVNSEGKPYITQESGIYIVEQGRATKVLDSKEFPMISKVNTMLHASNDDLWVGTDKGVILFDKQYQEQSQLNLNFQLEKSINVLLENKQKNILIGTDSGLYKVVGSQLQIVNGLQERSIEALIPDYATISSITNMPNGYVIASVKDRGLLVGKDNEWRLLTTENGLNNADTFFTQMTSDGYLWAVSSVGVYRIKAKEFASSEFIKLKPQFIVGFQDKLRSEIAEYCCSGSKYSSAYLHEDMLYVNTSDGMIALDTKTPIQNKPAPVPYIREQSLENIGNWQAVTKDIELSPKQRNLRLKFSSIQLVDGLIVHYRYRLAGSDWVYIGSDHVASFTSLAPGERLFELQASLRENEWSSSARLNVTRQPSFLETSYFKMLVLFGLVVLYILLIALRAKFLRRRSEYIENVIQRKTSNLRKVNSLLNQANENLQRVSQTDALTGLYNRYYLESNKEILALNDVEITTQNACTAIVIFDIDYFKRVNDTHGHVVGDRVLQEFAQLLKNSLHVTDEVIRWGGEEFLIVLHYAEGQLSAILKRLSQSIRVHNFRVGDGITLKLTVSIGALATTTIALRNSINKFTNLFQCADLSLYSVKRNGRDGWAYISAAEKQLQQAILSAQIPDDIYQLLSSNVFDWHASRSNISINTDNKIVELFLVRNQKDN